MLTSVPEKRPFEKESFQTAFGRRRAANTWTHGAEKVAVVFIYKPAAEFWNIPCADIQEGSSEIKCQARQQELCMIFP